MCRDETNIQEVIQTESFVIKEKLPSLNDVIAKNRANRYVGAKFKADIEKIISVYINNALKKGEIHKQEKPCWIAIEWREKTRRRDVDNIQSSTKFILDSLVKNNVLVDDSRKYVVNVVHSIVSAKENSVKVTFCNEVEMIIK